MSEPTKLIKLYQSVVDKQLSMPKAGHLQTNPGGKGIFTT
jgi:hypothetical protein